MTRRAAGPQIEFWPIKKVLPYPRNARTHSDEQLEQLARSIIEFGFTNPILVDEHGMILAGHGRRLAALRLELRQVPVIVKTGLTAAQKSALRLADNRLGLSSGWDDELLRAELEQLRASGFDLGLIGFSDEELADLLGVPSAETASEDVVPAPPARPTTKPGDIYVLGDHRLLCGDSTKFDDLGRLMAGQHAGMIFTDPPYNIDYEGAAGKIDNDHLSSEDFLLFLRKAFAVMYLGVQAGAGVYVAHSETFGTVFRAALEGAGFKLSCCLIWRKNSMTLGRSDYQWQHEPILYAWKPTARRRWFGGRRQTTIRELGPDNPFHQIGDHEFMISVGDRALVVSGQDVKIRELRSTVISEPRPARSELHPTMKPVRLVERLVINSSRRGEIVLDPFGGSGSTLIACEKQGRGCYTIELAPKFCDVIVRRWEEFSGKKASRLR